MSVKLKMSFINASDKSTSYYLDDPRADITAGEVSAVMNDMITGNIFNTSGGNLVSVSKAQVVATTVNDLI